MSNLFFGSDDVSTNETALVGLAKGRHTYKILKAGFSLKDDGSGVKKPTGINVAFLKEDTQTRHTHHYATGADGDRGRLARGDMKALWEAMKLGGQPGPDRFPNFVDKRVDILAEKTPVPNNPDAEPYTNIKGTWPASEAPRAAETPATTPAVTAPAAPVYTKDDEMPMETAPSAPPAETPATTPAAGGWKARRAAAKATA